VARHRQAARFDAITQDWLRDPAKRWSRFRLATGCAFATISAGALALSRANLQQRLWSEQHQPRLTRRVQRNNPQAEPNR
jgi:hypothetical protein